VEIYLWKLILNEKQRERKAIEEMDKQNRE